MKSNEALIVALTTSAAHSAAFSSASRIAVTEKAPPIGIDGGAGMPPRLAVRSAPILAMAAEMSETMSAAWGRRSSPPS